MRKADNPFRGDQLAVVSVEAKLVSPDVTKPLWSLAGRTILYSSVTGAAHGEVVPGSWSERTQKLLQELVASMEEDQMRNHFGEVQRGVTASEYLRGGAGTK